MNYPDSLLGEAELLLKERRLPEAMQAFHRAEQHGADADRCSGGRWMASMLMGRFASAWRESDAIRRRGAPDPHRFWNGEAIDGKTVIVRCLHGLGDAIQFLRYVPMLRRRAAAVIVETSPELAALAECIDGVERVISWGKRAPARPPRWDVQIEVTELPYCFRTDLRDLPLATEYMQLPQAMLRSAARVLEESQRMRVGVVWSCGEWNLSRSIPFPALLPLFEDSRIDFWNLQGRAVRKEWHACSHLRNSQDAPEFCADAGLLPLACFMAQMDLILTVDTVTAHLGGALGIPTWTMLRYEADWRWMTERSDSPWYPSLRLFRQSANRDWGEVVEQVRSELGRWAKRTDKKAA